MEFKNVILLHEDFLADFGFSLDNRSLYYVKKTLQGRQMVFFHHTQHEEVSYLEYHLGIRIEKVEQIVHRFLPSLGDYKERSISLVETMDNIDDKMPRRFLVENDLEIDQVIRMVEEFLVKKGFKFLDKYASGKALENILMRIHQALLLLKISHTNPQGALRSVSFSILKITRRPKNCISIC